MTTKPTTHLERLAAKAGPLDGGILAGSRYHVPTAKALATARHMIGLVAEESSITRLALKLDRLPREADAPKNRKIA